jgi:predicted RNase H-like HicB family nuclease
MAKKYTISDGKLVLTIEAAPEGGFVVSSPLDPGMWTQAESVDEAFVNARDALKELAAARRERKPRRISSGRVA